MKSKKISYEKLTLFETYRNRCTTQYKFFYFIWREKIYWLNFSHEKLKNTMKRIKIFLSSIVEKSVHHVMTNKKLKLTPEEIPKIRFIVAFQHTSPICQKMILQRNNTTRFCLNHVKVQLLDETRKEIIFIWIEKDPKTKKIVSYESFSNKTWK